MAYMIRQKIEGNGKIIGVVALETDSCKTFNIRKGDLRNYEFINARITSDLRILSDEFIPTVDADILSGSKKTLTLYHGSHGGIKGNISPTVSRNVCDFGKGFYTGNLELQAKTIVCEDDSSYLYKLSIDVSGLRIYYFDDYLLWAMYIGFNRGYINISECPKLKPIFNEINSCDIIVGLIADDRLYTVLGNFIDGFVTDIALLTCLQYVNYGYQFVFKTQRACDLIKIVSKVKLSDTEKNKLRHKKNITIGSLESKIRSVIDKYNYYGHFIRAIEDRFK